MAASTGVEDMARVRAHPGMYLGSTGSTGLEFLVLEVVSNALDQVIVGNANQIRVQFESDGAVTITDNGPGMPMTTNQSGTTFVEETFTTVRSTPTADGHAPHVHLAFGVGLGPVSAVCRSSVVETTTAQGVFRQSFSRGHATSPLELVGPFRGATGTRVRLLPDTEIFGEASWNRDALRDKLRTLAWLTPGLQVEVDGERFGPVDDLTELFTEVRGPRWDVLHGKPFLLSGSDGSSFASLAVGWIHPRVPPSLRSFCNFREMPEGGTQVQGVEEGLRLVFGAAPMRDLMLGLVGVLHVTMLDPAVGGPTRGRLDSPEAIWLVADTIAAGLPPQLDRHRELAESLQQRVPTRPPLPGREGEAGDTLPVLGGE